ncbi:MAG TPA: GAF domain-containing protein [Vicinamibacterales bacterium]|nr:GAF domain-containing protein [Vicinamibacterales bacterium]
MALEDRIRASVELAVDQLRTRIEGDVRAIVERVLTSAHEEQNEALVVARRAALDEGMQDTQRQIEEAEARIRESMEQSMSEARVRERELDAIEIRRLVEIEAAQATSEAVQAGETRMHIAMTDARATAEQERNEAVEAACIREREAQIASGTRLLDSIRGLDGATSLSEVLDALGQAAGREASRAAVLVLRGDRLLGWKLAGFGARDSQPKTIDLGLNEAGVIGLAVGAARPATTRDGETAAQGPGFTHLPLDRMGLAVPVIVGGRVVAVVYADSVTADGREHAAVPSGWPEVIEVLSRHAARCLEALTVQKAASTPSPRFWVPPGGPTSARGAATQGTAAPPNNLAADIAGAPAGPDVPPGVSV